MIWKWAGESGNARRGLSRAIAVQILILTMTFGAAEIILRMIDLRYLRVQLASAERIYNYDAELGWIPAPEVALTLTGRRPIQLRHNSLGLRDVEVESEPKPTIAFFGDSFVWGYDVEANERFTELLRVTLPEHRVVNAGVNGYGTDQEYLLLNRLWERIRPNVVVLVFCTDNDRTDNTTNVRYGGHYKPFFVTSEGRFSGIPVPWPRHLYFRDNWLAQNSMLVRAAVSAYVQLRDPAISLSDPTEDLIGMMREMAESRGAKFVVGLQFREPQLESYLRERKIPYVSFDGAEQYYDDGGHWTPKGHTFVADRLMTLFSETGIVPPGTRTSRGSTGPDLFQ
jgi:hypothetical protein